MKNTNRITQNVKFATLGFFALTLAAFASSSYAQPAQTTKEFVDQVAVRSVAIISAAEMALEISTSQEVRGYAQKMVSEYESILASTKDLADDKDVKIADEKELKETARSLLFEERNQASFDVAYGNNQVPAVQQLIHIFQQAAESSDYEIRNLATATLPKLRRHLLMAEQLLAGTAETKTDIHQERDNQLDSTNPNSANEENKRIPTTDRVYP